MTTGTLKELILDGAETCHTFLAYIITSDGYDYRDQQKTLNWKNDNGKTRKDYEGSGVKKATKIRIAETIIFPTVTYGSESWTVQKRERKKINAFELWTWRRIL